jgi:porphobilinogen synthase
LNDPHAPYRPTQRPRDERRGAAVRDRLADVQVTVDQLIMPLFCREGRHQRRPVSAMPGVFQRSPDEAVDEIRRMADRGVGRFVLFGVIPPGKKDAVGSAALDADNPVCTTLGMARDAALNVELIADLCFCEYTDHGHCGVLSSDPQTTVDNDATLDRLGRQAVVLARSGAGLVAPSGMIDGQVGAVRSALDAAGHDAVGIMSYTAKYASSLYGPFREAGEGAPGFGDRRAYQMDYRRGEEWRRELQLDLEEGADIVMVKPAVAYLDIVRRMREATPGHIPVAAYHVSGEFSMLHAAAENGWCDLREAAIEHTTAIGRAGADRIVTYFAPRLAEWLA